MSSNTLIINFMFNPPVIEVIGKLNERTIEKINSELPSMTTSSHQRRLNHEDPRVVYVDSNPPHWRIKLHGQFCDQLGESWVFCRMLDWVEEEGWELVTTHALAQKDDDAIQQEYYEMYKFFLTRSP